MFVAIQTFVVEEPRPADGYPAAAGRGIPPFGRACSSPPAPRCAKVVVKKKVIIRSPPARSAGVTVIARRYAPAASRRQPRGLKRIATLPHAPPLRPVLTFSVVVSFRAGARPSVARGLVASCSSSAAYPCVTPCGLLPPQTPGLSSTAGILLRRPCLLATLASPRRIRLLVS